MAPCAVRAIRCYYHYTSEQRSDRDTLRLGHKQRKAFGEFYYVHPLRDDRAYPTRKQAEAQVLVGYLRIAA